jgi:prepilin-type N-terminal cleavage/methylation domain-containing protein
MKNSRGFTLIEIVITIVLISILSGIAALIILQGINTYTGEQSRSDVHYQARIAMERMAREIRLIRSQGADITSLLPADLRFIDINGSAVGFNWVAATQTVNRWNGAGNDMLAAGVTAFTFTYYQQDGVTTPATSANLGFVQIDMTAQQGAETLQLRSRVFPRNF